MESENGEMKGIPRRVSLPASQFSVPAVRRRVRSSQRCRFGGRRRAMTLLEILVVMSVMVVLISAVVVAVFRISGKAPEQGTKGLLEKLSVGLEAYRTTYRMYPPEEYLAVNPNNSQDSYQRSSWVLWYALEYQGEGQFMAPVSVAYKGFGGFFTDPRTGASQKWYYYQDAWKQPIRYLCGSPYTQYTLTSGGADLILDTADDIVKP